MINTLLFLTFRQISEDKIKNQIPEIYSHIRYKILFQLLNNIRQKELKKIKIQNDLLDEIDIVNDTIKYIKFKEFLIQRRRLYHDRIFLKNDNDLSTDINEKIYVVILAISFLNKKSFRTRYLYRYKKQLLKNYINNYDYISFVLTSIKPRSYSDFLLIVEFGSAEIIYYTIKNLIDDSFYRLFKRYEFTEEKYLTNGLKLLLQCNTIPIQINNIYRIKDKEIKNIINKNKELYPKKISINYLVHDKIPHILGIGLGFLLYSHYINPK